MSDWISVEDRVPAERYVDVLIGGYDEFTDEFVIMIESYEDAPETLTHWMPLPEPPKDD